MHHALIIARAWLTWQREWMQMSWLTQYGPSVLRSLHKTPAFGRRRMCEDEAPEGGRTVACPEPSLPVLPQQAQSVVHKRGAARA
jgi:hypothetical protein